MTDLADTYRRRAEAFAALIESTPSERWSSPSPCEGWTARDVVAHVIDYSAQVLREGAGVPAPAFSDSGNPAAAFRATHSVLGRVLEDEATPPKVAGHLHWSLSFDLPQHGWDLAVATGQDPTIDPAEAELLWGSLTGDPRNWDRQRANGCTGRPYRFRRTRHSRTGCSGSLGEIRNGKGLDSRTYIRIE